MWPHTVAILMGGTSSRMGTPKHEVMLPTGKTMMDAMITFASCTAKNTLIVGGDINGQHCIHDRQLGLGPVAGIEAMLMSNIDSRYLVVGCDMPLLKTKTVQPLFVSGNAVCFSGNSKNQPLSSLPLVIDATCALACSAYLESGKRSLYGFLHALSAKVITKPSGFEQQLSSINTLEQLNNCSFE